MIRRLRVDWPDPRPFADRPGMPIRFLAVSDVQDPALEHAVNRDALGRLDGIIGCGDLAPSWLSFLADAFGSPVVYVRGNHDHGGAWADRSVLVPAWLVPGHTDRLAGIAIGGLEWPGIDERRNRRRPWRAWRDALGLARRALAARATGRGEPILVISHAPPKGAGDVSTDAYHVGFGAYRWLMDVLRPPLWLHGHTTTASVAALVIQSGRTAVVNVTGAVLIDLCPPPARPI
jgi:Icc-related predicted phosphoesterase